MHPPPELHLFRSPITNPNNVMLTGEYRPPRRGERYANAYTTNHLHVMTTDHDYEPDNCRWILKDAPVKVNLIAPRPPPPQQWLDAAGLECTGEFRPPKNDEWIVSDHEHTPGMYWSVSSFRQAIVPGDYRPRWILQITNKCSKPPQSTLDTYKLELTGEFRLPKTGEWVVAMSSKDTYVTLIPYAFQIHTDSGAWPRWILRKKG